MAKEFRLQQYYIERSKKNVAAILCCLVCVFTTVAQTKVTDSLQNVLKNYVKKDTVRVNLLNAIAGKIFETEGDKALALTHEAETLSETLHYQKGQANSLLTTACVISYKGN